MTGYLSNYLATLGLTTIALPTSDFHPLTLVYETHGVRGWSNDFDHLVQGPTLAAPIVTAPVDYVAFNGKTATNLDVTSSISILNGLVGALGGGKLGVSGGFQNAHSVSFSFDHVTMVEVSQAGLEDYLRSGTAPRHGTILADYIADHLYIASRVLRTRTITVAAQNTQGENIGLDIPVIQQAVGATVKLDHKTDASLAISAQGDVDVAFAFEAMLVKLVGIGHGVNSMTVRPVAPGKASTFSAIVNANVFHIDDIEGGPGLTPVAPMSGFHPTVLRTADNGPVLGVGAATES